jgi:hypothetical protein
VQSVVWPKDRRFKRVRFRLLPVKFHSATDKHGQHGLSVNEVWRPINGCPYRSTAVRVVFNGCVRVVFNRCVRVVFNGCVRVVSVCPWLILLEVIDCGILSGFQKPASFVRLYRSKEEFLYKYGYA